MLETKKYVLTVEGETEHFSYSESPNSPLIINQSID